MPQAVTSVFYAFLQTLAFAGASYGTAVVVATFATAAVVVGSLYAMRKITEALIGVPKLSRPAQDVEYSGTVESRRIIYGEMLISGMNVIPPMTSGNNNNYLHQVLAIAGHECNSLGTVYFNREDVGTISSVTGTDNDGKLTSIGRYKDKAWVRRYSGTTSQTVDYKLAAAFPSQWTPDHRGRGIAYIALTYLFDEEAYRQGKPEVTCLVQGKKVYDPRLDSTRTGGSGSQRINDATTWTYSTNPALCLADFLYDNSLGLGESDTRIDYDMVMDAADICDETVTVPGGTQKRYTCNAVLIATDAFEENIKALAQAMAGICYYSSGKWRMYAGAWSASAFSLTDSDLVEGGISIITAAPYNERYNSVRGTFIDKDSNWQATEYLPVVTPSYVTADGEQAWIQTDFACCTNQYEAQRHAILLARRSRNAQVATVRCGLSAFKIRPFETGTCTFSEIGWTSKTVRCEGWRFDPAGFVELVLREEASTDWNDPLTTDYTQPGAVTAPTPSSYTPQPPTGLSSTGLQNAIYFKWTASPSLPADGFYELYEYTASTPFSSATKIWFGSATAALIDKADTTVRYYWVRAKVPSGGVSSTEPPSTGIAGSTLTISTVLGASANPTSIDKTDTTASITTASTTVTATGGTTPYTYSWSRISGSTSISANSASSATTTFTGSSLASGSTYQATFRCTVTDGASATKTVDVSVSITRAAMTASASPSTLYKIGSSSSQTTASTTVTVTGGTSPYTYAWTLVTGDTLTVDSPSAATTTFTKTSIPSFGEYSATYRCTVTDSTSGTPLTATADVFVTIERTT